MKTAIIGAGHIGQAIARGLLRGGSVGPSDLTLANPTLLKLKDFQKKTKVRVTSDNIKAAKGADVLVIAVKPDVVRSVVCEIKKIVKKEAVVVSVAACVTIDLVEKYFHPHKPKIVRLMPNLPVAYGLGVCGLLPNKQIVKEDKEKVEKLLSCLGLLVWVRSDEGLDKLSMISGSGPAYVAYFMHALEKAAVGYGLSPSGAESIVSQTFIGTLFLLSEKNIQAEKLVDEVSTKGGITEEVIGNLDKNEFQKVFKESIKKGKNKIIKITQQLEV